MYLLILTLESKLPFSVGTETDQLTYLLLPELNVLYSVAPNPITRCSGRYTLKIRGGWV